MRAGSLDKKLTVQRSAQIIDAYGVLNMRWTTIHELRAKVVQASSDEFLSSAGMASGSATLFRIQFVPVEATDRILFNSQIYDIKATNEIGHKKRLEICAVERAGS
jgi:head-tail adaptor